MSVARRASCRGTPGRQPSYVSPPQPGPGQAHRPGAVASVEDRQVPDAAGGTQTLQVYKPEGVIDAAPIIMWTHGGSSA